MQVKEYIAYKGQEFQIEWYYAPKGDSQALEYYQKLALYKTRVKEGIYYEKEE